MIIARLERRVLGAVRFVDGVTGQPVTERLVVEAEGVRWIRNRRGLWAIAMAPGLETHTESFTAPPAVPLLQSVVVVIEVRDPVGRYLARRASITLPRDADPLNASSPDSLFVPVDVVLFRSPSAPIWPGWAVVRATLAGAQPGSVRAGALIRVLRQSDDVVLARALSDARGEALVAVHGIPSATFAPGPGPVLATDVAATLQVIHDETVTAAPDPDDLEVRSAQLEVARVAVTLASGRHETLAIP